MDPADVHPLIPEAPVALERDGPHLDRGKALDGGVVDRAAHLGRGKPLHAPHLARGREQLHLAGIGERRLDVVPRFVPGGRAQVVERVSGRERDHGLRVKAAGLVVAAQGVRASGTHRARHLIRRDRLGELHPHLRTADPAHDGQCIVDRADEIALCGLVELRRGCALEERLAAFHHGALHLLGEREQREALASGSLGRRVERGDALRVRARLVELAEDVAEVLRDDLVVERRHAVLVAWVVGEHGFARWDGNVIGSRLCGLPDRTAKGCRRPLVGGVDEGVPGRVVPFGLDQFSIDAPPFPALW